MSGNFLHEPVLGGVSPQELYEAGLREQAARVATEEVVRQDLARTLQVRHQVPRIGSAAIGGPAPKALDEIGDRGEELSVQLVDLDLIGDDTEWQKRALCAQTDPEAFFPEKGGSTREAKRICSRCEVKSECLEYALGHDERFGIWGGLSERERRRLKRRVA